MMHKLVSFIVERSMDAAILGTFLVCWAVFVCYCLSLDKEND